MGTLLAKISPFMGQIKAELLLALGLAFSLLLFYAGMRAEGLIKEAEIADLKAQQAGKEAVDATQALQQLSDASKIVHDAAQRSMVNVAGLEQAINNLQKEFRNAKPLPADCRPDDFRLKHLEAAVEAVKRSLAGEVRP